MHNCFYVIFTRCLNYSIISIDKQYKNRNIKIKNKLLAGLLALFLGGMGIHRFYLGYIKIGIVQLSLWGLGYFTGGITWVIVQIWALIESILIFLGKIKDSEGNDLE